MPTEKERLLEIAAQVVAGERDRSELEANGLTLGEPIVGEEAREMLLGELEQTETNEQMLAEHCHAAEQLWSEMAASGVEEGSLGRFEAVFSAHDHGSAESLAAEIGQDDGWYARVSASNGKFETTVSTRPLVRGREVVVELAKQMVILAREFGCDFVEIRPVPRSRRPWWQFWLPPTMVLALGCSGTSGTYGSSDTGGSSTTSSGSTQSTSASGGSASVGGSGAGGGSGTQDSSSSTPATGGQSSVGVTSTGGTRTVTESSGGASSTTTGGKSGLGGSYAATGGKSAAGGTGAGGKSGSDTSTNTGGRAATGGAIAMGGKSSAGGASTTGGKSTTGGGTAVGGKNATGGASTAGGGTSGGGTTTCDVSAPPANVAAWVEESWNAEGRNNMSWHKTWLHDSAMLGKGEINICVRYGATQSVSTTTRDRIAPAMQRWFNKWFSKLYPYDCFPYPSVTVKVTGWAVKPGQEALLQWTDRTVPVYTEVSDGSDQAKGEPKCPDNCGFFFHPDHVFTGCPNGTDAHFDYTLWLNDKLPSGAAAEGSNWGVRIPVAAFIKDLETDDFLVMLHEIGHGFGISDYYSWTGSTPVGGSVMMLGTTNTVSIGDQWMARRYWSETKALRYR